MSNDTAKTAPAHRIPDAAIAAFTCVVLLAMLCNPVSLAFLGEVFGPVVTFLGQTVGAIARAVAMIWSRVTPW